MTSMVDPYIGYLSFRDEVEHGNLHLESGKLYPDIKLYFDKVEGQKRLTYTILKENIPKGILQVTPSGWEQDVFYFQLGIAVSEEFRGQGIGSELNRKGIEEFLANYPLSKGEKLGIEVIISETNIASQRLAAKFFPDPPIQLTDKCSGEAALRYEFIVVG